jgi:hypothetical protein
VLELLVLLNELNFHGVNYLVGAITTALPMHFQSPVFGKWGTAT